MFLHVRSFSSVEIISSEQYLVEFNRVIEFLNIKFDLMPNLVINSKDLPTIPFRLRGTQITLEKRLCGEPLDQPTQPTIECYTALLNFNCYSVAVLTACRLSMVYPNMS